MRVPTILIVGALLLVTCVDTDDRSKPKLTVLNNRFKRQTSNELNAHLRNIKIVPTKKPTINLVKTLNVRPVNVPINQIKVLNAPKTRLNNNINNIKPKQLTMDKTPSITITDNQHNEILLNNKEGHNSKSQDDNSHKLIDTNSNEKRNEHVKETKDVKPEVSLKPSSNIVVKEKIKHTSSKESIKAASNEILPLKSNEEKKSPPQLKSKHELDSEKDIPAKTDKSSENLIKHESLVKLPNDNLPDLKPSPKKLLQEQVKPTTPKTITEKETSADELVKTGKTSLTPDVPIDDENKANDTNESSVIPLQVNVDKTLKLEGGEEIVIQNNNYEELYETNRSPQYYNPKLINSELRYPQTWEMNAPTYNKNYETDEMEQYVYDDMITKYNQNIDNLYNGLTSRNNFNNYYQWNQSNQPQSFGQWRSYYQPEHGRIWRTWRNNQVFIRPRSNSNSYGYGQKPVSSNFGENSYGNQNTYPYYYNAPTCACNYHGY